MAGIKCHLNHCYSLINLFVLDVSAITIYFMFSSLISVQFSLSVVSDSLRPHELQHARPPYLSPTPRVHSESRPLSWWCHPAISSSVVPFSSCPQSLPASESFPMSQHFTWGGQSTGVSVLASFLPKKSQDWSPSEWTVFSVNLLLPSFQKCSSTHQTKHFRSVEEELKEKEKVL